VRSTNSSRGPSRNLKPHWFLGIGGAVKFGRMCPVTIWDDLHIMDNTQTNDLGSGIDSALQGSEGCKAGIIGRQSSRHDHESGQ
jgi:hypothetical protein